MRPPTTTTSAACSAILVHCCLLRTENCSIFDMAGGARQPAGLPHWQPVLQAAFGPQAVQPARNLQRRALTDIPLEDFAVISDGLDDAVRPIICQPERLAELALDAKQTPHIRRVGFHHIVDVALSDAELFGID